MNGNGRSLDDVTGLSAGEKAAVDEFAKRLRDRFGPAVKEIVLFGSKARGHGSPDSDIDVLIVLDALSWDKKKQISELAAEENLRYDTVISTVRFDTNLWAMPATQASPFVKSVRESGIWL